MCAWCPQKLEAIIRSLRAVEMVGSHYRVLGIELKSSLNPERSACLCLLSARIKSTLYHTQLMFCLFVFNIGICSNGIPFYCCLFYLLDSGALDKPFFFLFLCMTIFLKKYILDYYNVVTLGSDFFPELVAIGLLVCFFDF